MSLKKYQYFTEVINDQDSSHIPGVAFHPNGSIFVVTYLDNDEVRIYDSTSLALLRTFRNPESLLCCPHGIAVTENHIIVSNKIVSSYVEPGIFTVYKIDDPSPKPVIVYQTPIEHLGEAHSFDIHKEKLVVAYCGQQSGAILTYNFNDETGNISGPISILEGFKKYVQPKGICFNEDGRKVIITLTDREHGTQNNYNCLAVFDVDENGILSREPTQIIYKPDSRLENISISGGLCVIADSINNSVLVYDVDSENYFDNPPVIIQEHLAFPHDACLSPDNKLLVVTNYGLKVSNREVHWGDFLQPRCDKVTIFKLPT